MTRRITPQTTLDNLKKEAKRWLKGVRENDALARERLERIHPKAPADPALRDIQHALALEHGFDNWAALKKVVEGRAASPAADLERFEGAARDLVSAYATGDDAAIGRLRKHFKMEFNWSDLRASVWGKVYKVRQARGASESFGLQEAKELMAREAGFPNWSAYMSAVAKGAPPPGPPYVIRKTEGHVRPRRQLEAQDWEIVLAAMRDSKVSRLDAGGQMTDDTLAQIAEMEHVTSLDLSGSTRLTDEGLRLLARMPQLEKLILSGSNITDRGLEVLQHLPELRKFGLTWQKGVSDAGISNLRSCDKLESVELMGSPAGDAVMDALRGKAELRHFSSGRFVTDAGLAMLRDFPRFQQWAGGECRYDLMTRGEEPTFLLIDGPFTDAGLATVARLDGVSGLQLFWHVENVTAAGIGRLVEMRNLHHFRAEEKLADDAAMHHFARMPHLRMLVIQGTVASDDGFEALSQSPTVEYIWGRECPNLTGRGFAALSKMQSLRGLGVSCKNVDDASLALLPAFPALREFMPMDVKDDGFRHVGNCKQLENLWCMYCRDAGDEATEHVAGLQLKTYYAGMTQITDRSLEILGRMNSLEVIEFYETNGVTDAGLAHLARLPSLRRISVTGLPNITWDGTKIFPPQVQVNYDV